MIENVSTQLTVFHCFAHCLLPGRAFASLYALLFLEKEAEIGGRVRARLFIDVMWSPARKGLISWLSFVMSYCEVVSFPMVSWVRCGS